MAREKTYVMDSNPTSKKEWVLNRKINYFINVNVCTQTGSTQYITNLPLTEAEVKKIVEQESA